MNKKILIAGLLVSIMLIVPINSAYSNIDIPIDNKPIIKTNPVNPSNGTFMKTFGGTDPDFGYYVQQTTDGGYIITGEKGSYFTEHYDIWLIKTDKDGRPRDKSISSSPLLRLLERYPLLNRPLSIFVK
jgi:hypothetical protein